MDRKLLLVVDKLVRDECAAAAGGSKIVPAPEFIVALAQAASDYAMTALLPDLVAFAAHAKRRVVNVDDVKLAARKSAVLSAKLARFDDEIQAKKPSGNSAAARGSAGASAQSGKGARKRQKRVAAAKEASSSEGEGENRRKDPEDHQEEEEEEEERTFFDRGGGDDNDDDEDMGYGW